MTEKTPEHVCGLQGFAPMHGDHCVACDDSPTADDCRKCRYGTAITRAAVEAERERCAKCNFHSIKCPLCNSQPGTPCWDLDRKRPCGGTHRTRIAAAIRARR